MAAEHERIQAERARSDRQATDALKTLRERTAQDRAAQAGPFGSPIPGVQEVVRQEPSTTHVNWGQIPKAAVQLVEQTAKNLGEGVKNLFEEKEPEPERSFTEQVGDAVQNVRDFDQRFSHQGPEESAEKPPKTWAELRRADYLTDGSFEQDRQEVPDRSYAQVEKRGREASATEW